MNTVAFAPNETFAYIAVAPELMPPGAVLRVNPSTNQITSSVTGSFIYPSSVAISPNNAFAYVTDASGEVFVINTSTNTVSNTVTDASPAFASPNGVAISPQGSFAYVTDTDNAEVYRVNTQTHAVTQNVTNTSLTAFSEPKSVAISPNGKLAGVADGTSDAIYLIDTATNAVTHVFSALSSDASDVPSLAFSADNQSLYVASGGSNLYRINLTNFTSAALPNSNPFVSANSVAISIPSTPSQIPTTGLTGNNLRLANLFNNTGGEALDTILGSGNTDFIPVMGALSSLSSATSIDTALETFTPDMSSAITSAVMVTGSAGLGIFGTRIDQLAYSKRWQDRADTLMADGSANMPIKREATSLTPQKSSVSLWAQGIGEYQKIKPHQQTPNFSAASGGVLVGAGYNGVGGSTIGAGLGYLHSYIKQAHDAGHSHADQGSAFVYGVFPIDTWYIGASVLGGYYHGKNVRHISFTGFSGGNANSTVHGWQLSPHLEGGYTHRMGWLCLQPFVMIDYVATWQHGFKESGSTPFNFEIAAKSSSFLRAQTGLRVSEELLFDFGKITFLEMLGYGYQKAFGTGVATVSLVDEPGSTTLTTFTQGQNLGMGSFQAFFVPKNNVCYTSLGFSTALGASYQSYQLLAELGKNF